MLSADNLVILDRDGVINHDSDNYIKSLEEWVPYPSSITALPASPARDTPLPSQRINPGLPEAIMMKQPSIRCMNT